MYRFAGCVCKSGFALSGEHCVAIAKCGCREKGLYYMPGQRWLDELCRVRKQCINGIIQTSPASCAKDAVCMQVAGLRVCQCNSGFIGDGEKSCKREFLGVGPKSLRDG